MGVNANIGETRGATRALRVRSPCRLLLPLSVDRQREPILSIFHPDNAYIANRTCSDHLTGLAHHRITSIVEADRKHETRGTRALEEITSVLQGGGEGLVADDVDAGAHEGSRNWRVQVIRSHDNYGFDAVAAGGLGQRHLFVTRVSSIRRNADVGG